MAITSSSPNFEEARRQLNVSSDGLAAQVLALDDKRAACLRLAGSCDDFAGQMAGQPLAAPASRLAALYRDLELSLGRISGTTEELTAAAGRVADALAAAPSR